MTPADPPADFGELSRAEPTLIRLAHSPDSDDAFMFYALAAGKLPTGHLRFAHELHDIETLNQRARQGTYEVTALSIHAYGHLHRRYLLLPCGGSVGEGYGPLVVAREELSPAQLRGRRVAVPGRLTTAFLVLKLLEPDFEPVVVPFDRVLEAVRQGRAEAGLLIHEGQLSYAREGFVAVIDLGHWWREQTGLPLPLGGNAVLRRLGAETIREVSRLLRQSVEYALAHREEALTYALQFARGLPRREMDRFVGMYVNEFTLDFGPRGRAGVRELLRRAHLAGLLPEAVEPDFAP